MRPSVFLSCILLLGSAAIFADERRLSVQDLCDRIGAKLGSVSIRDCQRGRLQETRHYSVKGLPIAVREYPPLPYRSPQGRVLLIGGIHGDEYSSVSIVFKWMQILDEHHSGLFHWRVAPLMNPDGLLQRKSRRMNARGVDLNRNFPTPDWQRESRYYWEVRTGKNPRRYPGPAPMSEPESRWLVEEIERFQPDVIVSVHAPHGIIDFDGPPKAPRKLGHLQLNLLGTYPGSLGNYAGVQQRIPVITIELPYAGIMPTRQQVSHIWTDLVQWLIKNTPRPPAQVNRYIKENS